MMEQGALFHTGMNEPLANRMRPRTLKDYVGQQHLLGEGRILRQLIENDMVPSMIFWGPPGVGKTTLAQDHRAADAGGLHQFQCGQQRDQRDSGSDEAGPGRCPTERADDRVRR